MESAAQITELLRRIDADEPGAMDALMEAVYAELERMARVQLNRRFGSRAGHVTLQPAALVNEAFLKLLRQRAAFHNRDHFFAISTRLMMRVLIDYSRARAAAKRGAGRTRIILDPGQEPVDDAAGPARDLIGVEELAAALERLDSFSPRRADVVRMRVVWGLEMREIAESLGVSLTTVERDWRFAKSWLAEEAALPQDDDHETTDAH